MAQVDSFEEASEEGFFGGRGGGGVTDSTKTRKGRYYKKKYDTRLPTIAFSEARPTPLPLIGRSPDELDGSLVGAQSDGGGETLRNAARPRRGAPRAGAIRLRFEDESCLDAPARPPRRRPGPLLLRLRDVEPLPPGRSGALSARRSGGKRLRHAEDRLRVRRKRRLWLLGADGLRRVTASLRPQHDMGSDHGKRVRWRRMRARLREADDAGRVFSAGRLRADHVVLRLRGANVHSRPGPPRLHVRESVASESGRPRRAGGVRRPVRRRGDRHAGSKVDIRRRRPARIRRGLRVPTAQRAGDDARRRVRPPLPPCDPRLPPPAPDQRRRLRSRVGASLLPEIHERRGRGRRLPARRRQRGLRQLGSGRPLHLRLSGGRRQARLRLLLLFQACGMLSQRL